MADLTAPFPTALLALAGQLLTDCRNRGLKIATAESCTGGLIAGLLTEIPGSSDVVERGFVVYSNEAKVELLGVSEALIREHGAVSEPVALAMAEGALARSRADLSIAVTGVAGPGGGSEAKPVGLVHLAVGRSGTAGLHDRQIFAGDRAAVRMATVVRALALLQRRLD